MLNLMECWQFLYNDEILLRVLQYVHPNETINLVSVLLESIVYNISSLQ